MDVDNEIRKFLISKGVEPFWVDSHMVSIRWALSSNSHFASDIKDQTVKVKNGYATLYKARVTLHMPNIAMCERVTLKYTFRPEHKKAHKIFLLDREVCDA